MSSAGTSPGACGPTVDLNADLGEAFGPWGPADERALLEVVTTAHVACGFHAGDPAVMRRTVRDAAAAGVVVGAHPSYPDLVGFGRRPMEVEPARVVDDVLYQVGALAALCRAEGTTVQSVKPHGALYNRAAVDPACAVALAEAVLALGFPARLVLAAGQPGTDAARTAGATVVAEGFCDRAYRADGTLAPREDPAGVITDPAVAAARAVSMAVDHRVEAVDGGTVTLWVDTLCVHGDTPGALSLARSVGAALAGAGLQVRAPAG